MNVNASSHSISWLQRFWQDLRPTPGRLNRTLRMVLASVILLVLLLILQMPFANYGLYVIFVLGQESPSLSLRTGLASSLVVSLAISIEMGVVILTDNDPMARVLSVVVITFISGLILVCTSLPSLGWMLGFFYCILIAFWEGHSPEDVLVKNSLRLLATLALAIACGVAVEYIFGARSPVDRLAEQLSIRYRALQEMFGLFAQEASPDQRFEAAARVSRLAAAGQAGMTDLFNQIVDRDLDSSILPIGTRVHITMLAELMDDSAAFGLQSETPDDAEFRQRCARIAEQCGRLIPTALPQSEKRLEPSRHTTDGLLGRVEAALHAILVMPVDLGVAKNKDLAAVASKKVPVLIPGAIKDKDNIAFALKISFCATLCYILYHAIDWAGTSTSVTTVMVAGLTTTGAMKQRLAFRLLGATVGGLVLGIGATAFLFPYMDSITSLVILIAVIAFVAGWIAGGSRFNYIGLQLVFAFYLVAFEGFSAPTELAPARDRFVGILFAIVVMWFVFDRLWPVRTVTAMRRSLANVLRSGASLLLLINNAKERDQVRRETESLRDRVGKNISALRTMSEVVEYEFGVDREQHVRSSELILQSSLTAAGLIWNQVAFLHDDWRVDFTAEPSLVEMRRKLADHLNSMAESIDRREAISLHDAAGLVSPSLLDSKHYSEYVRNTIARYEDLRNLAAMISREA
jgi:multidrug resistance protein MdtO